MKRNMGKICLWKISAILAVLGLVLGFASCGGGGDWGTGGVDGPGQFGANMSLNNQVYELGGTAFSPTFTRYNGNRTIPAVTWVPGIGRVVLGSATITNGQLNLHLGTPTAGLISIGEIFWESVRVNPAATRGVDFLLETSDVDLFRGNIVALGNENSGTLTFTTVMYIYVDRDANISADRYENSGVDGGGIFWTETINPFNLDLGAGWNALRRTTVVNWTGTTETSTVTFALGETSDLRWILDDWSSSSANIMPTLSPQGPRRTFMRSR